MSDGNGALPEGWEEATLGDVSEIIRGVTFPSKDKRTEPEDGCVMCLRTSNVQEDVEWDDVLYIPREYVKNDSRWLRHLDILISMANSYELVGKVAVTLREPEDVTFGGFISAIRANGVDPKYLFFALREPETKEWIRRTASRTVNIANISLKGITPTALRIAPEAEQRRIVSKIESLQERSSRARVALSEVGPLLDQFRQSVLRAAFSGRLTADWRAAHRDVEPATELLSRIRTERRHRWEQSELAKYEAKGKKPPKNWQDKYKEPPRISEEVETMLPQLPESWCWAALEELKNFDPNSMTDGPFGSKLKTVHYTESGIRVVRLGNIGVGEFKPKDESFISEERYEGLRKHEICAGDVVIAALAEPVGRACLIPDSIGRAIVKADCIRFRPHQDVLPESIMHWLNSATGRRIAEEASHGIGRLRINMENMRSLPVALPPIEEQAELVQLINEQLEGIEAIGAKVAESESSLTQLDQSILAKAFRGELVPQDPRDEPASELLARIKAERDAAEGNGKKTKKKRTKRKPAHK